MYTRVVTVQIQPGKMDEVINVFRNSIKPIAEQQKGYRGGYFLTDHKTGKAISIALWETEADMKAGETSEYLQQQIAKVASAFAAPPTTEHFEVSVE